jgi:hypothetical protein
VLLRFLMAAVLLLALTGCGSAKQQAAATTAATTTAPALPPGCTVEEVNTIVRDFLAHPSLAPPGSFEVYATYESDGRKFVTHTRAQALTHLRARLRGGEKSRVFELRVGTQDFNHVRITFQLTRRAPDFVKRGIHQRLVTGGGTIDCAHQKVAAWVTRGP